ALAILLLRALGRRLTGRETAAVAGLVLAGVFTKTTALVWIPLLPSGWDLRRHVTRGGGLTGDGLPRLAALALLPELFVTGPRRPPALDRAVPTLTRGLADALPSLGPLGEAWRYRAEWLPLDFTLLRRYLSVLFSGFWGNFGHMEAPLSLSLYGLLAL